MGVNPFFKLYCRCFQKIMYVAVFCLPWNQNKGTLSGAGSIKELPQFLKDKGFENILIVTDGVSHLLRAITFDPLDQKAPHTLLLVDQH